MISPEYLVATIGYNPTMFNHGEFNKYHANALDGVNVAIKARDCGLTRTYHGVLDPINSEWNCIKVGDEQIVLEYVREIRLNGPKALPVGVKVESQCCGMTTMEKLNTIGYTGRYHADGGIFIPCTAEEIPVIKKNLIANLIIPPR